jgi:hypothetical protein
MRPRKAARHPSAAAAMVSRDLPSDPDQARHLQHFSNGERQGRVHGSQGAGTDYPDQLSGSAASHLTEARIGTASSRPRGETTCGQGAM